MLPRALESIIIEIGFSLLFLMTPDNSSAILSLALFQAATTFWYLSSSVIKPRLNCLEIFSTVASASSRYSLLCSDKIISPIPIDIPDIVDSL